MFSLFVGQFNAQIVLPQASTIASKQGGDERLERHRSKNQIEIHSFFSLTLNLFYGIGERRSFPLIFVASFGNPIESVDLSNDE